MIKVSELTYDYPSARALKGVSLNVSKGSITALVGPNGAGKTTLMRCLAALQPSFGGNIEIDGIDAAKSPREIHARLGYLPEFYGLYDSLSVRRCLTYTALSRGMTQEKTAVAAEMTAKRVGLQGRMEAKAAELSRDLRQRLAIGQAVVHEPLVLLLDEPAAGLDPDGRRDLSHLLVRLKNDGMTVVVSSHILAELEEYCTSMIVMDEGRIVGGRPLKVRDDERPRYLVEIATPRSDLKDFLAGQSGVDLIEADQHHALFTFTRNAGARARLVRDLVGAGFDLSNFGESTKALEEAFFTSLVVAKE